MMYQLRNQLIKYLNLGYSNMLNKMNLKKDRIKDIQDALKSADTDGVC